MMTCKADWKFYTKSFIDKFVKANPNINLNDVLFVEKNKSFAISKNDQLIPLGCNYCIEGDVWQTEDGDITIGNTILLNCKNFAIDNNLKIGNEIAEEISNNIWICPNCRRWILDFLPKFDTLKMTGS